MVTRKDAEGNLVTMSVKNWNATVANLTLMALGSSAPEIMLSIIETVSNLGKAPGQLGPSTIVGACPVPACKLVQCPIGWYNSQPI